jgi:hypothetical protein
MVMPLFLHASIITTSVSFPASPKRLGEEGGGGFMTFVLLFGPQAVGKMTVGKELAALTGFRLFHNHMTIEPLYAIFGDARETWRLSNAFRRAIFEAAAESVV